MAESLNTALLSRLPDGVAGPGYDRAALRHGIVHIGVGNFHRAHQAVYLDRLFATGRDHDWAILGAGVRPADHAMRERLGRQDWLYSVVDLDPEGLSARVVGAMTGFAEVAPEANIAAMAAPETRIVSLTVTEGGYYVDAATGGFDADHPEIATDLRGGPPATVFGQICAALKRRFDAGVPPFTVMSCDNLPENGHVAQAAVLGFARASDPALADRIAAEVAFPNGMVDCITPATSPREIAMVQERFGIEDAAPVVCEPFRQWVLEDRFPAGRPRLEEVGVEFVDDVLPYELMKLRILNAGHAAIAYPAALLGLELSADAMDDTDVAGWLRAFITREAIPLLPPIPGVSFADYLDTCAARFGNRAVGDTIARLCFDGSNRQPKFILPGLRDALAAGREIPGYALELALWCRYCAGPDEHGQPIRIEDERAEKLRAAALAARQTPEAFLALGEVFGDLGQDPRLRDAFAKALGDLWRDGTRATLRRYVNG